ncbi:MAG: class I SAM-dependent methyltransferase [Chitinophagaceae bacterium]|nr:class I SAM-dependent methyltransferase [Anaerolineae bacterium]
MTQTQHLGRNIDVEYVQCPSCGKDDYSQVAAGPDYDHHCCGEQVFTLVRCKICGFSYLNPRPTTAMLPIIYSIENYVCYGYTENRPILAAASKRFEDTRARYVLENMPEVNLANFKALDIGAGEGRALLSFQDLGVPVGNLYAVDISDDVLEPLKAIGMQTVNSRAEDLDLPENTFDIVMMNQVIEHVADPRKVMEISYRLLKPGGFILMDTPNLDGYDRPLFRKRRWGGYHFPRHWVLFSTNTMTRMLQEVGFGNIQIQNVSGAFVWSWSFSHTFQDWKLPLSRFFSPERSFAMFFGALIDALPSRLAHSSNMRAVAIKPR